MKWISVKERVPDLEGCFIAWIDKSGCRSHTFRDPYEDYWEKVYYDPESKKWTCLDVQHCEVIVSHWMSLPEKPIEMD